jgi:hypothetical protein
VGVNAAVGVFIPDNSIVYVPAIASLVVCCGIYVIVRKPPAEAAANAGLVETVSIRVVPPTLKLRLNPVILSFIAYAIGIFIRIVGGDAPPFKFPIVVVNINRYDIVEFLMKSQRLSINCPAVALSDDGTVESCVNIKEAVLGDAVIPSITPVPYPSDGAIQDPNRPFRYDRESHTLTNKTKTSANNTVYLSWNNSDIFIYGRV